MRVRINYTNGKSWNATRVVDCYEANNKFHYVRSVKRDKVLCEESYSVPLFDVRSIEVKDGKDYHHKQVARK